MNMFAPCSTRHRKGCSRFHADLVQGYRLARHAQEIEFEPILNNQAEFELARANGFRMITFADWLRGLRGTAAA
ncbi:hypothetical protein SEA_EFRA2_57 [Mycobacterium phage Efra2]|nr:hypothetical protein SEA_EFRA2_57 [Mycobacterium phage Efra2]